MRLLSLPNSNSNNNNIYKIKNHYNELTTLNLKNEVEIDNINTSNNYKADIQRTSLWGIANQFYHRYNYNYHYH